MISNSLNTIEYHPYYKLYIDKATSKNIVEGLCDNLDKVVDFYNTIPAAKYNYAYQNNKWTIKQIILHIIDTERIFTYRALRIGRQDKTPLKGYEQDDFAKYSNANKRSFKSLIDEYTSVRKATIALFESFSANDLLLIGNASGSDISLRALGYILTGHENHHIKVIKARYLSE